MKIQAPTTLRQTFLAFTFYNANLGLQSILEAFDWSNVLPSQIYISLLGRLPESAEVAIPSFDYRPTKLFQQVLSSDEFQEKFIENFVAAFPEKVRYLFVHIPKCAGMDLEFDLEKRYLTLPQALTMPHMTPKAKLWEKMASLAHEALFCDTIFINGHIPLAWYIDHQVYRFSDKIFSVIRDPVSLILSWVNYIVTVCLNDPEVNRLDTAEWLAALGETHLSTTMTQDEVFNLAQRVLYNDALVRPNYLCSYLGTGTAESTIAPLAVSNVEVVHIARYREWRDRVWGMDEGAHRNQSIQILMVSKLREVDRQRLAYLTMQDQSFYNCVSPILKASPSSFVRGLILAREMRIHSGRQDV